MAVTTQGRPMAPKNSEPQLTAKQKKEAREAAALAAAKADGRAEALAELNTASAIHPDKVADAHGAIEKPSSAGQKVVVACKLGVAYYDIQLCKPEEVSENTQTGPRTITQWKRTGNIVRLRGTAYPRGTPPEGFPEKPVIVDGAALTFGVDKEFWDAWVEQNARNPIVMNKMVFAHVTIDGAKGMARELKGVQSGLEPVNPKNDARMPKSTRTDVSNIETEESRAAKMERATAAVGG